MQLDGMLTGSTAGYPSILCGRNSNFGAIMRSTASYHELRDDYHDRKEYQSSCQQLKRDGLH